MQQSEEKHLNTAKSCSTGLCIHYACSDLDGKVFCIGVKDLANNSTLIFPYDASSISPESFNEEQEKQILDEFFKFVPEHYKRPWFNWNGNSNTYGFKHLIARYKSLGGRIPKNKIPSEDLQINVSALFWQAYGDDYIDHRRLAKILELNEPALMKDFLYAETEALGFQGNNKLSLSVRNKVEGISRLIQKHVAGTLKTKQSSNTAQSGQNGQTDTKVQSIAKHISFNDRQSAIYHGEQLLKTFKKLDSYLFRFFEHLYNKAGKSISFKELEKEMGFNRTLDHSYINRLIYNLGFTSLLKHQFFQIDSQRQMIIFRRQPPIERIKQSGLEHLE